MIELRCSYLHQVRACAPSLYGPQDIRIEGDRGAADMGSAEHECWNFRATTGQEPDIARIAAKYLVDEAELADRHGVTWSAWKKVEEYFPFPEFEVSLRYEDPNLEIALTGHIDCMSFGRNPLGILDLKSGFGDYDHRDQLRAYAWLVVHNYGATQIFAATLRPRNLERGLEGWLWTYEELEDWWRHFAEDLIQNRNVYRPGYQQCTHCPRGVSCEERTRLFQQAVAGLFCAKLPPMPSLGLTLDQVKMIEKVCAETREWIKAEVALRGGSMDSGDGRDLVVTRQQRESVKATVQAVNAITHVIAPEDWENVFSVSKTELRKAVMATQPHGQKGAAADKVLGRLRDFGAIETTYIDKLEIRRREETTDERTLPDHTADSPGCGESS